MDLDTALHILCRVHTSGDHLTGFRVNAGSYAAWHNETATADWIEAWKTVRAHCHLPVEPGHYPASDSPAPKKDLV